MLCSRCSTNLPQGSEFCLKWGQRVTSGADNPALAPVPASVVAGQQPLRAPRKRRIVPWLLVLVLLGAGLWAATSESPIARHLQEFVGWSHVRTIVDAEVSVNTRSFSSYEFTAPPGALKVTVTRNFNASTGSPHNGNTNETAKDHDTGIMEVFDRCRIGGVE